MSIRLSLSGFPLAELRKLLGGRNPAVIAALEARLAREGEHRAGGPDDLAFAREFRGALRLAVERGVPFEGLDREGVAHALLADWLVDLTERRVPTDCDLKYLPLLELLEAAERRPDPVARQGLGHLLEGRPLFGRRFSESPSYGFLSLAEARELQAQLEALADEDDGESDVAAMAIDLADYLGEITSKSLDVWAFVA